MDMQFIKLGNKTGVITNFDYPFNSMFNKKS